MATKNLNPESKEQQEQKKQDILKSTAAMATAAVGGAVVGACISKVQSEDEPTPEPVNVATPILEEEEPANPIYTGPTYEHDPESASESQQQQNNTNTNASSNSGNGNASNTNNGGATPNNGGGSSNTNPENEDAKHEIDHDEIDPNDLDVEDKFIVLGFDTRYTDSGEEVEVAIIVDEEGNQLLLRDVDGNGKYDTVYTIDNELVGTFKSESLGKSDLIEKMQTLGYINPIEENIPPHVLPTGEDIAILDAEDAEIEEIINSMISENGNYMAYANVPDSESENGERDTIENEELEDSDDDDATAEYDYDDTVNEEEILAMLDDEDNEEDNDDDDADDDDADDDNAGDDMDDLGELNG